MEWFLVLWPASPDKNTLTILDALHIHLAAGIVQLTLGKPSALQINKIWPALKQRDPGRQRPAVLERAWLSAALALHQVLYHKIHGYERKDRKSLKMSQVWLRSALPLQSSLPSLPQWPDPFNRFKRYSNNRCQVQLKSQAPQHPSAEH